MMNSGSAGEPETQKSVNIHRVTDAVPHILHYCWFGQAPLSPTAQRSLSSWKKFAPGFALRRWDERNAPLDDCAFVREAYQAGKWAFVADYVRFWALYHFGGVYMDMGSELIRDITPLLAYAPFSAYEAVSKSATPGLIACCAPNDDIIREVLDAYQQLGFINTKEYLLAHTVNKVFTAVLEEHGLQRLDRQQRVRGWTIFPSKYFDPLYGLGGYHVTEQTYSIHHSSASWLDPVQQTKQTVQMRVIPFLGHRLGQIAGRIAGEIKHNGIQGVKNLFGVTHDVIQRGKHGDDVC